MGQSTTPHEETATAPRRRMVRVRPLPVRSTLRLQRAADIWHKPAISAATAMAVPNFTLFAVGRLDLVLYTAGGALCALYAHNLPYAARARALAWVVLGMVASVALALTVASVTDSPVVLVLGAALTAAAHKLLCDATHIGPPGHVILTFITASSFFVPQQLGEVPGHLALTATCGALAWLVCMAPALVRPHGPERIAVARALEAAAALQTSDPAAGKRARHATATAVNAAWRTLFLVPARSPRAATSRAALERLLIRAESALAGGEAPDATSPAARASGGDTTRLTAPVDGAASAGRTSEGARHTSWARLLRRGRPVPTIHLTPAQRTALAGVDADRIAAGEAEAQHRATHGPGRGPRGVYAQLRPGSPLLPVAVRAATGCALAGLLSLALGVGRPYWAIVTAASIFQANTTLSWQRAVQRTVGNFVGLLVFVALLPLVDGGPIAMILVCLSCQTAAEAFIARNYWLGSLWVTPMALVITEFAGRLPAHELIADRAIDTVVGAAAGLLCCVAVTNRRATDRTHLALRRVAAAHEAARAFLANAPAEGGAAGDDDRRRAEQVRDGLASALLELRESADVSAGEWWQRALPDEQVAHAERTGHQALAEVIGWLPPVPAAARGVV